MAVADTLRITCSSECGTVEGSQAGALRDSSMLRYEWE